MKLASTNGFHFGTHDIWRRLGIPDTFDRQDDRLSGKRCLGSSGIMSASEQNRARIGRTFEAQLRMAANLSR